MKKLLVALLTFAIGVFAFGLLNFKTSFNLGVKEVTLNEIPVSTTPVSKNLLDIPQEIKPENNLPFFKSFGKNGYGGWFIADDFKGMPEVWTILLMKDFADSKNDKLIWKAMILTQLKSGDPDDDADFSSLWIKTEINKLSFKTKKYRNVEYKFSGTFFKNGNNFEQEEKVLKGTMQKFVKGKKVAEFTADFAYFEPHCFH